MKRKTWPAALLALLLAVALPFSAAAQTYSTEDFTMEVPDGMFQFGPNTSTEDPTWALAGVADPQRKLQDYQEMGGIAEFISEDGETAVLVMQRENSTSQQVFNVKYLSEEEQAQFLENLMTSNTEEITVDKRYVDFNGQPFYRIQVDGSVEGVEHHELLYGTIVNGYALNFDVYGGDYPVTQEQDDLLVAMLETVSFPEILPMPESTAGGDLVVSLVLLGVMVLVLLVPLVYFPLKNRHNKKVKAQLAEQLTEYHKTHGNKDAVEGELRFSNSTDCTREAIHTFSLYQAYVKSIGSLVAGGLLCLATLAVSFALDAEWWVKLLSVGVAAYYGYKIFSMPSSIEKVQRRVYQRGVSSTAHYAFYDEAFRISGIQSASVFPYFQITDVRRHSHYAYLYYGPENAYMVDQYGFSVGDWESFLKFISEKTGKKV